MKKFLNISIIIFILISFSLVGCKNINENSSNTASEDTEISKSLNLKNIKVPDKIIFYNNNDAKEITKDSKKFNDIVKQVDFSLGGIQDSLKCEVNFEGEKKGKLLELDFSKEENFIYNSSIGEEKEVYNKIYINLGLEKPNHLDDFYVASFSKNNNNYGALFGNVLEYEKLVSTVVNN